MNTKSLFSFKQFFLCASLLLLLSGCGFHLRGSIALPEWAKIMYLASETPYGRFEVQLKRALSASGVRFIEDPKLAAVTLQILEQTSDKTVLTLGADARAQDFQLTYSVRLQLLDKTQKVLIAPITLTQSRHFAFNKAEVLGKSEEETLLLSDMRRELVYQAIQIIRGGLPSR